MYKDCHVWTYTIVTAFDCHASSVLDYLVSYDHDTQKANLQPVHINQLLRLFCAVAGLVSVISISIHSLVSNDHS